MKNINNIFVLAKNHSRNTDPDPPDCPPGCIPKDGSCKPPCEKNCCNGSCRIKGEWGKPVWQCD